jgi:hypothetical protein
LFSQLVHAETSAVTPETELAYLALVPSKHEIATVEDADDEVQIISSKKNDDDLMDMSPISTTPIVPVSPTAPAGSEATVATITAIIDEIQVKSPSILGKRTSDHLESEPMILDVKESSRSPLRARDNNIDDNDIIMDTPSILPTKLPLLPLSATSQTPTLGSATSAQRGIHDDNLENRTPIQDRVEGQQEDDSSIEISKLDDDDVEMTIAAPALPPRKRSIVERRANSMSQKKGKGVSKDLEKQVSSYMAFGEFSFFQRGMTT